MSNGNSLRNHTSQVENPAGEQTFCEFRRKVRNMEVLSAAMEKILRLLKYTGKLSIIVQNGEVLKSGYEEGYFRRQGDLVL